MPQAQVWILDISDPGGASAGMQQEHAWLAAGWLHASEWRAAQAFRHPLHRRQHLAGRVLARTRLAMHLDVMPQRIGFGKAPSGKPNATLDGATLAAHFNISHSGARVAFAFADCDVGVDIESRNARVDALSIARRFFAPAEARWIECGGDKATARFGALWTLKEACLKAQGLGLSSGLDSFTLQRTGFRSLRASSAKPGSTTTAWHCHLRPLPGYWAAVCTALPCTGLSWRQITPGAL